MENPTLVIAIDLGTSSATASYARVRDHLDRQGRLQRRISGKIIDVRDWPLSGVGDGSGRICVPTDLIYDKSTRQLLCWGFQAQIYLNDPRLQLKHEDILVVEHIKVLLPDPDEDPANPVSAARHRARREMLHEILGKDPFETFEDFMDRVVDHVVESAHSSRSGIHSYQMELVLAFPSGWPDHIHKKVAQIGARAMQKAVKAKCLQNMTFGIENVYTVSETLCGVKEWLRDAIAESNPSNELDLDDIPNLDELQEGDLFLPIDIGAGTGCMTLLKLVSKHPIRVDQLGPTQSLEVSGEAVEFQFEQWLRQIIKKNDVSGNHLHLINRICREFKEEKKFSGEYLLSGSRTWNCPAEGLKENLSKGFTKSFMPIERKFLDRSFDPVIDTLEAAISEKLQMFPSIKAVIFLGQFGGCSKYLKQRLDRSPISSIVKVRQSKSGKMDVVKGALAERLHLTESFVRKSETLKSYGSLVTLEYYPGSDAEQLFPNPQEAGAVPFEEHVENEWPKLKNEWPWLLVIDWVVPKGTSLNNDNNGSTNVISKYGRHNSHHTWLYRDKNIAFEDIIIVSDEIPPDPHTDGHSYTLWTTAHEEDQLFVNGKRMHVQQIPFSWDISMSQKIDLAGNLVGPYGIEDLQTCKWPEEKRKGHRRIKYRKLHYDLIWSITEMQVKVHIEAIFPNHQGPRSTQLAKERQLGPEEKAPTGESRSKALERDMEIVSAAASGVADAPHVVGSTEEPQDLRSIPRPPQDQQLARTQIQQLGRTQIRAPEMNMLSELPAQLSSCDTRNSTGPGLLPKAASSKFLTPDRAYHDACYPCKVRKMRCDSRYTFNETTGCQSCEKCSSLPTNCFIVQPDWANNPGQVKAIQSEFKELGNLGKRKARDDSDFYGTIPRDRPTNF